MFSVSCTRQRFKVRVSTRALKISSSCLSFQLPLCKICINKSLHCGRSWKQSQMPEVHWLDTLDMMQGRGWVVAIFAVMVSASEGKHCHCEAKTAEKSHCQHLNVRINFCVVVALLDILCLVHVVVYITYIEHNMLLIFVLWFAQPNFFGSSFYTECFFLFLFFLWFHSDC